MKFGRISARAGDSSSSFRKRVHTRGSWNDAMAQIAEFGIDLKQITVFLANAFLRELNIA